MSKPRTGIPSDQSTSPAFATARSGAPTASDFSKPNPNALRGVVNESAYGEAQATKRYGYGTQHPDLGNGSGNQNKPQKLGDANNQQGNYYDNDVRNSWLRGAGESATGKPHFDFNRPDGPPVGGNRDTPGRGPK